MKNELASLITPNAEAGLSLAAVLAWEMRSQLDRAHSKVERPGGMSCLLPAPVPLEIVGSILFYAIAAANRGWANAGGTDKTFLREQAAA